MRSHLKRNKRTYYGVAGPVGDPIPLMLDAFIQSDKGCVCKR